MKLLNYTSAWFGLILFLVLSIWATVFYFNMLDEIYDSMDDGLENQKLLVIRRAEQDGEVLLRDDFDDGYYKVSQVPFEQVPGEHPHARSDFQYFFIAVQGEGARNLFGYGPVPEEVLSQMFFGTYPFPNSPFRSFTF